ncbi:hypothetical protein NMY22_g20101 [Coprinellus aureogranulatus]|nr:hypothetical protein NMY22_g20101 [Coprinellus aureogranulatus]
MYMCIWTVSEWTFRRNLEAPHYLRRSPRSTSLTARCTLTPIDLQTHSSDDPQPVVRLLLRIPFNDPKSPTEHLLPILSLSTLAVIVFEVHSLFENGSSGSAYGVVT